MFHIIIYEKVHNFDEIQPLVGHLGFFPCEQREFQVRQWLDDNQLKKLLGKEKVTLIRRQRDPHTGEEHDIEEEHALKIPDGYVWLDLGQR